MKYLSVKEVAAVWEISERRVQKLCLSGRIEGAVLFSGTWAIPYDANKPVDRRKKDKLTKHNDTSVRIKDALYGDLQRTLNNSDNCTVFTIENETGNGIITQYSIFGGIEVFYNDFHLSTGVCHDEILSSDIIEINHCREGRCECILNNGQLVYIGKGDLALNCLYNQSKESEFPLSHYHGISIIIHINSASRALESLSNEIGGIEINLSNLKNNVKKHPFVMRTNKAIGHIFSELYYSPEVLRKSYLSIKILELLLFLCNSEFDCKQEEESYLYESQVVQIKDIQKYIIKHIDEKITIEMLSDKFNIAVTTLKNNFKTVYGTPISTYLREYRMQYAMDLLKNSKKTVLEISSLVGYENQTSFTSTFKKFYNKPPSCFRKSIV